MPKNLADYLKYLSLNASAYNEYFRWKEYVRFDREKAPDLLCNMCIDLHLETHMGIRRGVVDKLESYWNVRDCKQATVETVSVFGFKSEFVKSTNLLEFQRNLVSYMKKKTVKLTDLIIGLCILLIVSLNLFIFRQRFAELFNHLFRYIYRRY